ncbi:unannotated protein [freshwater metagenome]|uniref:Unannotated protein n=1 Tax=freshwater metagenome TaxID=449393 RepID=A0A6J6BRF4_9ZZZZ
MRFTFIPVTLTPRTPSIEPNTLGATSSRSGPSFSLSSLETPIEIIGTESKEPATTLALASFGSELSTAAIAAARFSFTLADVVPYSNSTRTMERLFCEVEVVVTRPSKVRTCSSTFWLTCLSITSAEAPGYEVIMAAWGVSKDGSNSCFNPPRERAPKAITMIVASATTDRLARLSFAKRYMIFLPRVLIQD